MATANPNEPRLVDMAGVHAAFAFRFSITNSRQVETHVR